MLAFFVAWNVCSTTVIWCLEKQLVFTRNRYWRIVNVDMFGRNKSACISGKNTIDVPGLILLVVAQYGD